MVLYNKPYLVDTINKKFVKIYKKMNLILILTKYGTIINKYVKN